MSVTSGWGRLTWDQANWNEATTFKTGWGAQQWSGDGGWGDLSDQTVSVSLTGIQITSSIGSVDIPDQIITPTGLESTFSQGEAFVPVVITGGSIAQQFSLRLGSPSVVDMQVGLTGVSTTSAIGSVTVADMTVGLTGLDATLSQGTAKAPNETAILSGLSITSEQGTATAISSQEAQLTGVQFSASIGSVTIPNDTVQLSGVEATFAQGTIIGLGSAIAQPTGLSTTASVGSLTVEEGLGLTGQSFTASVGSISPVDMQVGLDSLSATFNVGAIDIFAYGDVDTGSNTSYSNVSTGSNDTYSDVATGSNTSYSDAA